MTAGDVFYFVRGVAVLVFFVVAVLQKDERPKRRAANARNAVKIFSEGLI